LAVKHYQNVLRMEEDLKAQDGMFERDTALAKYTAYNLQQLYLVDGSPLAAKAVGEKWLSM
jgi:hypothetical protein